MGEQPEFKRRRGEDRGADEGGWGAERGGCDREGCGDGCPPLHCGRVREDAVPTPQKKKSILHLTCRQILVQTECFLYSSSYTIFDVRFQDSKHVDNPRETQNRLIDQNCVDNFVGNVLLLQHRKKPSPTD